MTPKGSSVYRIGHVTLWMSDDLVKLGLQGDTFVTIAAAGGAFHIGHIVHQYMTQESHHDPQR